MLGIDLGQRDKCAAVPGPALQRRQLIHRRFVSKHWPRGSLGRPHGKQSPQHGRHTQRVPQQFCRILLQTNQRLHAGQSVSEDEAGAIHRTKQIAGHRKSTVPDIVEQQRRTAGRVHPSLDLGRLQVGIDLFRNPDQHPAPFKTPHALL